jgi:hypothetical protein
MIQKQKYKFVVVFHTRFIIASCPVTEYFGCGIHVFLQFLKEISSDDVQKSEPGSSVSIVSGYGLDNRGSIPGRGRRIFPLTSMSRPSLGPTQPPVQWIPGVLSPGLNRGRGVTLTTQPHLVPKSRMSRSYTSSPPSAFVACSGTALTFRCPQESNHFFHLYQRLLFHLHR